MLNPIGKWKIKEVFSYSEKEDGVVWMTVEQAQAAADPDEEDGPNVMRDGVVEFTADGKVETLILIPESVSQAEIDESGMEVRDGWAVLDSKDWKTEDGKILYNTGGEGEVFGETVSPWVEVTEKDGGLIELVGLRLARAE